MDSNEQTDTDKLRRITDENRKAIDRMREEIRKLKERMNAKEPDGEERGQE